MRAEGGGKVHLKIISSARIVEPQYIARGECEVDSTEGVGRYLLIYVGSHNRTSHFGEYS